MSDIRKKERRVAKGIGGREIVGNVLEGLGTGLKIAKYALPVLANMIASIKAGAAEVEDAGKRLGGLQPTAGNTTGEVRETEGSWVEGLDMHAPYSNDTYRMEDPYGYYSTGDDPFKVKAADHTQDNDQSASGPTAQEHVETLYDTQDKDQSADGTAGSQAKSGGELDDCLKTKCGINGQNFISSTALKCAIDCVSSDISSINETVNRNKDNIADNEDLILGVVEKMSDTFTSRTDTAIVAREAMTGNYTSNSTAESGLSLQDKAPADSNGTDASQEGKLTKDELKERLKNPDVGLDGKPAITPDVYNHSLDEGSGYVLERYRELQKTIADLETTMAELQKTMVDLKENWRVTHRINRWLIAAVILEGAGIIYLVSQNCANHAAAKYRRNWYLDHFRQIEGTLRQIQGGVTYRTASRLDEECVNDIAKLFGFLSADGQHHTTVGSELCVSFLGLSDEDAKKNDLKDERGNFTKTMSKYFCAEITGGVRHLRIKSVIIDMMFRFLSGQASTPQAQFVGSKQLPEEFEIIRGKDLMQTLFGVIANRISSTARAALESHYRLFLDRLRLTNATLGEGAQRPAGAAAGGVTHANAGTAPQGASAPVSDESYSEVSASTRTGTTLSAGRDGIQRGSEETSRMSTSGSYEGKLTPESSDKYVDGSIDFDLRKPMPVSEEHRYRFRNKFSRSLPSGQDESSHGIL